MSYIHKEDNETKTASRFLPASLEVGVSSRGDEALCNQFCENQGMDVEEFLRGAREILSGVGFACGGGRKNGKSTTPI